LAVGGGAAPADDERRLQVVGAGGELLGPGPGDDDRVRRHPAPDLHRLGPGDVDDGDGAADGGVGAEDGPLFDDDALDDDGAAPDEAAVLDDDGTGAGRLEDPADAHAAGEVHVAADLGARPHRGPGVD